MKQIFILAHAEARRRAIDAVSKAEDGCKVTIADPSRTLDQNAAQWPILEAFSKQEQWPVNGQMCWLDPEDWKNILSVAFLRETVRIAQGLNGGVVMLGARTSKMPKRQFSEYLEFLNATAIERGIVLD